MLLYIDKNPRSKFGKSAGKFLNPNMALKSLISMKLVSKSENSSQLGIELTGFTTTHINTNFDEYNENMTRI